MTAGVGDRSAYVAASRVWETDEELLAAVKLIYGAPVYSAAGPCRAMQVGAAESCWYSVAPKGSSGGQGAVGIKVRDGATEVSVIFGGENSGSLVSSQRGGDGPAVGGAKWLGGFRL